MAVLGFLLLIVVILAVAAALLRGGATVKIDLEWFTIKTDANVVFFAGAAATLLFVLGVWLVVGGVRRSRRRRSEMRDLRQRAEASEKAGHEQASKSASTTTPGTSRDRSTSNGSDEHFDSAPRDR